MLDLEIQLLIITRSDGGLFSKNNGAKHRREELAAPSSAQVATVPENKELESIIVAKPVTTTLLGENPEGLSKARQVATAGILHL